MRRPGRPPALQARDAVGERLAQRVDEVRAHRVAAVDVQVRDQHAAVGAAIGEHAHLEGERATAALGEARHELPRVHGEHAIGGLAQLVARRPGRRRPA